MRVFFFPGLRDSVAKRSPKTVRAGPAGPKNNNGRRAGFRRHDARSNKEVVLQDGSSGLALCIALVRRLVATAVRVAMAAVLATAVKQAAAAMSATVVATVVAVIAVAAGGDHYGGGRRDHHGVGFGLVLRRRNHVRHGTRS